jgi:hypothetical protein
MGNDNPATPMRRTLLDERMLTDTSCAGNEVKGKSCYLFSEADEQIDCRWISKIMRKRREERDGWLRK